MDAKNYAEVLIDGKIYTLGGSEDERYLQRVASYINDKTAQLKKQSGFTKQSQDYQAVMVELNIADDYFKMLDESLEAKQQKEDMEKETYSLKHELVTTQMKLEAVLKARCQLSPSMPWGFQGSRSWNFKMRVSTKRLIKKNAREQAAYFFQPISSSSWMPKIR